MNESIKQEAEQPQAAPAAPQTPPAPETGAEQPLPEREEPDRDFQALIRGQYRESYLRHVAEVLAAQQAETERYAAYRELRREAAQLEREQPGFTLEKALDEPELARLLKAGVGLRTAWEVLHRGERERASAQRERALARPRENGLGGNAAAVVRPDPRALSRDERRELRRRAARGEKIVW